MGMSTSMSVSEFVSSCTNIILKMMELPYLQHDVFHVLLADRSSTEHGKSSLHEKDKTSLWLCTMKKNMKKVMNSFLFVVSKKKKKNNALKLEINHPHILSNLQRRENRIHLLPFQGYSLWPMNFDIQ